MRHYNWHDLDKVTTYKVNGFTVTEKGSNRRKETTAKKVKTSAKSRKLVRTQKIIDAQISKIDRTIKRKDTRLAKRRAKKRA